MKLLIPPLKTELELERDWTFNIHFESRNFDAIIFFNVHDEIVKIREDEINRRKENIDPSRYYGYVAGFKPNDICVPVTITKGSILIVDRIYIRNGSSGFDSVTFRLASTPTNKPKGKKSLCRFWAKLKDVNQIYFVDTREFLFR